MKELSVQMVGITMVAKIEPDYLETELEELLRERQYIKCLRATLPTMHDHDDAADALFRTRMKALQANFIATIEQNCLSGSDHWRRAMLDRATADSRAGQHGLQMPVLQPSRGLEIVAA
jgi:hypothetical protein